MKQQRGHAAPAGGSGSLLPEALHIVHARGQLGGIFRESDVYLLDIMTTVSLNMTLRDKSRRKLEKKHEEEHLEMGMPSSVMSLRLPTSTRTSLGEGAPSVLYSAPRDASGLTQQRTPLPAKLSVYFAGLIQVVSLSVSSVASVAHGRGFASVHFIQL